MAIFILFLLIMPFSVHAAEPPSFMIFADYSSTQTPYDYNEYMEIRVPEAEAKSKWTQINKHISEDGISSFEWIPNNQKLESRTEIITIQFMSKKTKDGKPALAREIVFNVYKSANLNYPDMIWNTIQDEDDDFMYEWSLPNGADGLPKQHEIVRVVSTDKGFHRIAYESRAPKLDEHTRQLWIYRLGSSRLLTKNEE